MVEVTERKESYAQRRHRETKERRAEEEARKTGMITIETPIPREVHTATGIYWEYPSGERIRAGGGGMVVQSQQRLKAQVPIQPTQPAPEAKQLQPAKKEFAGSTFFKEPLTTGQKFWYGHILAGEYISKKTGLQKWWEKKTETWEQPTGIKKAAIGAFAGVTMELPKFAFFSIAMETAAAKKAKSKQKLKLKEKPKKITKKDIAELEIKTREVWIRGEREAVREAYRMALKTGDPSKVKAVERMLERSLGKETAGTLVKDIRAQELIGITPTKWRGMKIAKTPPSIQPITYAKPSFNLLGGIPARLKGLPYIEALIAGLGTKIKTKPKPEIKPEATFYPAELTETIPKKREVPKLIPPVRLGQPTAPRLRQPTTTAPRLRQPTVTVPRQITPQIPRQPQPLRPRPSPPITTISFPKIPKGFPIIPFIPRIRMSMPKALGGREIGGKEFFRYSPSFAAITYKIKAPKIPSPPFKKRYWTGLEIRPIVSGSKIKIPKLRF